MKCPSVVVLCFFLASIGLSAQNSPVPLIHQPLAPMSASPGSAAFTLTVNGANFVAGDTVQWNRTPRTTVFVSPTQLTASISASDVATASTATVTVVSPAGGASNAVFFPITHPSPFVAFAGGGVTTGNDKPSDVTTADLNNDGTLELISDNVDENSIDVLQNLGQGMFSILHKYSGVTFPVSAVIADFNGDGKPDVAVGSSNGSSPGSAVIFLGNGDLTLQSPQSFPTAQGPVEDIVGGDFNRDGIIDLAVNTAQGLSVLLGNGDGTFQAHQDYAINTGPLSVTTADFNGDGILDLAVAAESAGSVLVLIGAGDGTFARPVNYPVVTNASYVSAVDVNGDGKQDLVVSAQFELSPLAVLLGNGDGTFQAPVVRDAVYASGTPVFGDLNGDGILDVVLPGVGPTVLLGRDDGSFGMLREYPSGGTRSVALGDFDNDGRLDAASAAFASHRIPVQLQTTAALTPGDITFPNQVIGVPSTAVPVTLTNLGWTNLAINSIVFGGIGGPNFVQTNNCPASLVAMATCVINVSFSPLQKGYVQSVLQVSDVALGSPQFVRLFGYGTVVLLTPNRFIFGMHKVGTVSSFKTATVTNTGSVALNVSLVSLQGSGAPQFHIMSNSCGSPVPPGGSCSVNVVFAPMQTGQAIANLTLVDDGGAPTDIVQVSGTGF
ncbi:MAG TPA: FG-GAP-like repeat-containing protein [Terriglobales bacterium]|nr:FG-GAP-like repeat-containing protein [Terriglobales bacterium]